MEGLLRGVDFQADDAQGRSALAREDGVEGITPGGGLGPFGELRQSRVAGGAEEAGKGLEAGEGKLAQPDAEEPGDATSIINRDIHGQCQEHLRTAIHELHEEDQVVVFDGQDRVLDRQGRAPSPGLPAGHPLLEQSVDLI